MPPNPNMLPGGCPTPLGDYMAKTGASLYDLARKLARSRQSITLHAYGIAAPSLATAFLYQEKLGIDVNLWALTQVVRLGMERFVPPSEEKSREYRNTWRRNKYRRERAADLARDAAVLYGVTLPSEAP